MGFQDGIIQLKGRVGNLAFYKTKDGYAARKASGVDGNKVRTHPAYARTRENNAEFQEAMKATKLFRAAFGDDVKTIGDRALARRLSSLMSKLVRQDNVNARGLRKVLPATTAALEGFNFNRVVSLPDALKIPFTPVLDRSTGRLAVDVPGFSPKQTMSVPEGATHFVLRVAAAEVDFAEGKFVALSTESQPIAVGELQQEALSLSNVLPGSTKPLLLAFGLRFIQVINGIRYALKTSLHSAMQVVKVDTGVAI